MSPAGADLKCGGFHSSGKLPVGEGNAGCLGGSGSGGNFQVHRLILDRERRGSGTKVLVIYSGPGANDFAWEGSDK